MPVGLNVVDGVTKGDSVTNKLVTGEALFEQTQAPLEILDSGGAVQ